jgi:hypothetical protein
MDLKWQDGAIPGKKLTKPSRTPEEVSRAKKNNMNRKDHGLLSSTGPPIALGYTTTNMNK